MLKDVSRPDDFVRDGATKLNNGQWMQTWGQGRQREFETGDNWTVGATGDL
jgi:hypothetical protein